MMLASICWQLLRYGLPPAPDYQPLSFPGHQYLHQAVRLICFMINIASFCGFSGFGDRVYLAMNGIVEHLLNSRLYFSLPKILFITALAISLGLP
jgi:hypothetical protein